MNIIITLSNKNDLTHDYDLHDFHEGVEAAQYGVRLNQIKLLDRSRARYKI